MHRQYLRYILRHKWYVFQECRRLGITWRGITHDLSKFRPDEWLPYARYFYGTFPKQAELTAYEKTYFDPRTQEQVSAEFDRAWLLHQHRNAHHWQHWLLSEDDGGQKVIGMSYSDMLEMLADWRGAGKAMGYGDNTAEWYAKHRDIIQLQPRVRERLEETMQGG